MKRSGVPWVSADPGMDGITAKGRAVAGGVGGSTQPLADFFSILLVGRVGPVELIERLPQCGAEFLQFRRALQSALGLYGPIQ